ncbi:MAG: hypothetical protein M0P13_03205 [Fibrobacteraceae bacterium]|nr:hypothetical protein [Fibrobacteraceae bacterium]
MRKSKNSRNDITKWLIHFVKDVNYKNIPGKTDDMFDFFSKDELEDGTSAFEVLREIIKVGGILARPSFRNGKTTLYGGEKVVCATEMPLYSFYKYASLRKSAGNVSSIGIAFLKKQFFAEGGRQAIYGLSKPLKFKKGGNTPFYRILLESCLPIQEQYRYVHVQLNGPGWTDWTHEREWRWKKTQPWHSIWREDSYEGLPLFKQDKHCCIDRFIVIVNDLEQAKIIQSDLTGFYLSGGNNYGTSFSRNVIKKVRIINMSEVVDKIEKSNFHEYETIEGLEKKDLIKPLILFSPPTTLQKQKIDNCLKNANTLAIKIKIPNASLAIGRCRVLSQEISNKWIQKMILSGLVDPPFDGIVVIHTGLFGSQLIDENEARAEKCKNELEKVFGKIFYLDPQFD